MNKPLAIAAAVALFLPIGGSAALLGGGAPRPLSFSLRLPSRKSADHCRTQKPGRSSRPVTPAAGAGAEPAGAAPDRRPHPAAARPAGRRGPGWRRCRGIASRDRDHAATDSTPPEPPPAPSRRHPRHRGRGPGGGFGGRREAVRGGGRREAVRGGGGRVRSAVWFGPGRFGSGTGVTVAPRVGAKPRLG
jgi:hypothetical protein